MLRWSLSLAINSGLSLLILPDGGKGAVRGATQKGEGLRVLPLG